MATYTIYNDKRDRVLAAMALRRPLTEAERAQTIANLAECEGHASEQHQQWLDTAPESVIASWCWVQLDNP